MNLPLRRIAAVVVAVGLVSGLLLGFADVSAATSETATDSGVAVSRVNDAAAGLDGRLYLYVHGEAPEEAVAAFVAALGERGVAVERIDALEPKDGPVAALAVDDWRLDWAAVGAGADVTWRVVYSPGNTTSFAGLLAGEPGVVHGAGNPYVLDGEFHTVDRTTGVVSWPAYRRGVAERAAAGAVDALWTHLGPGA